MQPISQICGKKKTPVAEGWITFERSQKISRGQRFFQMTQQSSHGAFTQRPTFGKEPPVLPRKITKQLLVNAYCSKTQWEFTEQTNRPSIFTIYLSMSTIRREDFHYRCQSVAARLWLPMIFVFVFVHVFCWVFYNFVLLNTSF